VTSLASGIVLGAMIFAQGNELLVREKVVKARGLAGVVKDSTEAPISNVEVQLISCSDFEKGSASIVKMVKTDDAGRFHFEQVTKEKLYCFQFQSPGFNLLRIRVTLSPHAGELRTTLTPGT
jgi:hypothetical protein